MVAQWHVTHIAERRKQIEIDAGLLHLKTQLQSLLSSSLYLIEVLQPSKRTSLAKQKVCRHICL